MGWPGEYACVKAGERYMARRISEVRECGAGRAQLGRLCMHLGAVRMHLGRTDSRKYPLCRAASREYPLFSCAKTRPRRERESA